MKIEIDEGLSLRGFGCARPPRPAPRPTRIARVIRWLKDHDSLLFNNS
jgi:hypothetical protein